MFNSVVYDKSLSFFPYNLGQGKWVFFAYNLGRRE